MGCSRRMRIMVPVPTVGDPVGEREGPDSVSTWDFTKIGFLSDILDNTHIHVTYPP